MRDKRDLCCTIVPCQVSEDYLKISRISHNVIGSELIAITPKHGQELLSTMFIKRKDIEIALENAEPLG